MRLKDEQRVYIKNNILEPMEKLIPKATIFGTVDRTLTMLNNSLKQLKFDKKLYEARITIEDKKKVIVVKVEARAKEIPDDIMSVEMKFSA